MSRPPPCFVTSSLTSRLFRYSLFFASRGASVVVNDLSPEACAKVVQEIQQAGGKAAAAAGSVTDGEQIVQQAVKAFGTVHILINNAGVLRESARV